LSYIRKSLVFAYGTLRPGCGNDAMLGNYRHLSTEKVPGSLHYHHSGWFPVLVPAGPDDYHCTVVGDVLLAEDRYLANVVAMEVFAGYDARWKTVGGHQEVLVFEWSHPTYDERIDSGDWYDTPGALVLPERKAT
jgi:gamma-glutamylcyclotransferase (GGCT)/AIG2-like uncharacterized protein YtfP